MGLQTRLGCDAGGRVNQFPSTHFLPRKLPCLDVILKCYLFLGIILFDIRGFIQCMYSFKVLPFSVYKIYFEQFHCSITIFHFWLICFWFCISQQNAGDLKNSNLGICPQMLLMHKKNTKKQYGIYTIRWLKDANETLSTKHGHHRIGNYQKILFLISYCNRTS